MTHCSARSGFHIRSALNLQKQTTTSILTPPTAPPLCCALIGRVERRLHGGHAEPAAPRGDWPAVLSVSLYNDVILFTWKPTATDGVRAARANHYKAAPIERSGAGGWFTAAQYEPLLSKLLYKCVYGQCGGIGKCALVRVSLKVLNNSENPRFNKALFVATSN